MKTRTNITKGIFAGVITLALVAFSTAIEKKKVDVKASKIEWKGEKLTGSHNGTIDLKDGYFEMEEGKLVQFNKTGRLKLLTLTKRGEQVADYIERIRGVI